MSIHDAAKLGHLMRTNIGAVPGLSALTVTILKRAGLRYAGEVRDSLVYDGKIPGVGEGRRLEIARALALHGSWPVDSNGHNYSHTFVALRAHEIGLADGKAVAERAAMTQVLRFEAISKFSVASMKDRILAAYAKKIGYVGFRIAVEHDVPGIGPMAAESEIMISVDGMNEMLRAWNPALREPVKGNLLLKVEDAPPREAEVVMKFEPCSGTLFLKPPDDEAMVRFKLAVGTSE